MDQIKIGKLIAECRKAKKMTQVELAEQLGVTDKSVSKWENGICLPDVSLYKELCSILGITLNEFFSGERLTDEKFKEVADDNLFSALENSIFTLKDKIDFFKKKWQKEHMSKIILCFISWIILITTLKLQNVEIYLIAIVAALLAMVFYITLYNQMMVYIERNAYGKKSSVSIDEFRTYIQRLEEFKIIISKFENKNDVVNYLMKETGLSKQECKDAYDIAMRIDFDKVK